MNMPNNFDEAAERFHAARREVFTRNNLLRAAGVALGVGLLFTVLSSRAYGAVATLGAFAGLVADGLALGVFSTRPKAAKTSSQPSRLEP